MKKLIGLLLLAPSGYCFSQNAPAFKQLRYEENYAALKNDSSSGWYKRTKYQPLSKNKDVYTSFGGDIRYQYFRFQHEDWGEAPEDKDGYLLTRYLLHADFHAGKYFRAFVQLQSSLANGKEKPSSPVDENQLDLHQAFVDLALPFSGRQEMTIRIGRQELLYGSQRLVAVRDGPNNRQSFDAARLIFSGHQWKADFFFSHPVRSNKQIFEDGFNRNARFWGAYLVKNKLAVAGNIDLYYFGLWKKQAAFDEGVAKELRHSIGSRIWNSTGNIRYDIEGVYQFGSFGDKRITAWTFSVNGGYKFNASKLRPEIGIKTEWISGDAAYGDNKLQTFNPLFPRGGYFGLAALIGPANLFDIHPSLTLDLAKQVSLNMDYDIFWRYSKNDGIYGPNVLVIYPGKKSDHKYVGRQFSSDIVYTPNGFLYLRGECTWFKTGEFLTDAGAGKNILFTALTAQLKF